MFTKALRKCGNIIVQTNNQRELLKYYFNINGTTIHNAHPDNGPRNIYPKNNSIGKILWVGRLIRRKRPEIVVALAKRLPEYNFYIIGADVEKAFTQIIIEGAKRIPNLFYLGELSNDKVLWHLKDSVLFLSTSKSEGFSNTFIESWKQGVPIVSLHVDPDDIIKKYGLGFVSHSFEKMVVDIRTILGNETLWKQKSQNCKVVFEQKFTLKKTIDKFEQYLRKNGFIY